MTATPLTAASTRPADGPRRVTMYVYNDATLDSRVRREAATLADAGLVVSVMAIAHPGVEEIERETVDGYEIVRVPVPDAWMRTWPSIVRPGVGRARSIAAAGRALRDGPGRWLRAGRHLLVAAGFVGLSVTRRLVLLVPRRIGGPGVWPPPSAYWLATWRGSIIAWADRAVEAAPGADVHHGHDLTGLVAAVRGAARDDTRVVYDSHEIFVDSGRNAERPRWARALLRWMERRWARGIVALVSVNEAYGAVIARRIRPPRTVIVHNCPPTWSPEPGTASRLAEAAGVPKGAPIVLYHGAFARKRGIEELAETMLEPGLERAHLVLLGYGWRHAELAAMAAQDRFAGRVHVLDAVPPDRLLELVAGADVDAIPLQRSTLNHWLCTPNKLFESLAAGVPVVVSDFPVMHRIVRDDPGGPLGEVCDPARPASIAAALRAILERPAPERAVLRERCRSAAHERWNWETESARLRSLYEEILAPPEAQGRAATSTAHGRR